MSPSTVRSSGTKPTPALSTSLTLWPRSSSPSSRIDPSQRSCRPRMASVSSVWPLPWTPATARISPRAMSKVMPSTTCWPVGAMTVRSLTLNVVSCGLAGALSRVRLTARPTIMEASSVVDAPGSALPTTLPRRMTVMVSDTAFTSRSLCEMKTIEVPLLFSWRMMSRSSSVSWGVSTAVGSSRMSTLASRTRALMISTRCWTPTGRSSISASGSTSNPYLSEISLIFRRVSSRFRKPPALVVSAPSATFSATVNTGTSMKCWCTMPMPAAMASPGPRKVTALPSTRISPSLGSYSP